MVYYYLKPYENPEEHVLHMFGVTEVFEEMQQTFHSLTLLAEQSPVFANALEQMTVTYD